MKSIQLQFGFTFKNKAIDIIIDNKGLHLYYDNLGDIDWDAEQAGHCLLADVEDKRDYISREDYEQLLRDNALSMPVISFRGDEGAK